MQKHTSLLLLIGAVIVIGVIGYAVTSKAPTHSDSAPSEATDGLVEPADADTAQDDAMEAADDALHVADLDADMPTQGAAPTESAPSAPAAANEVVVALSGTNFAFDREEIRVKLGDTVRIVFTSADGFHDWVVDEFGAHSAMVQTGQTTEVTFVADKAGSFEYYCSIGAHRANGMVGTLIVE